MSNAALSSVALAVLSTLAIASCAETGSMRQDIDRLTTEFASPPSSARPRVWWHWMNGNVTQEGIARDLEWMHGVGIAGVQNFDANLSTPQIVDRRLEYMTPEWREAFRFAVTRADQLGLEFTIASSPGWSETGGPWVSPDEAMKKVVWSEVVVEGGRRFNRSLPAPPTISGLYQDIPSSDFLASISGNVEHASPTLYRDIAVLAYPLAERPLPPPRSIMVAGRRLSVARLNDGEYAVGLTLPEHVTGQSPTPIEMRYDRPQTVRSATIYSGNAGAQLGFGRGLMARLEARIGGAWTPVSNLILRNVPTTVSFDAIRSDRFRVVIVPNPDVISIFDPGTPSPGADLAGAAMLGAVGSDLPPLTLAELSLSSEARVDEAQARAAFVMSHDYYALNDVPETSAPATSAVVDLTSRLQADGALDWTPPPGLWRIVRLGWSLTGKTNHPATTEATGLEVDKLDGQAVRNYLTHYIGMYRDAVGGDMIGARGVQAILNDSIEVGPANWTPQFVARFQELRGYDPTPYLPTLTGALIGSRDESNRFLYDYRRTISDLIATQHYGVVAEVAHENDLAVYGEALEWNPAFGDELDMRRFADYPMAAMWTYGMAPDATPSPIPVADMRGAASVAHLYGRARVAAESLTSALAPWDHTPANLRRVVDFEFANGVNLPVIHTSVHQPVDDRQPGLSLAIFGQFFNRHESWAPMARPWVDYLARNSYMLQQGRNVADVAYFLGEEAPTSAMALDERLGDLPKIFGYDFVNAHALLHVLSVREGRLVAPSGVSYSALYLGGSSRMVTLPTLRRIGELARQGATVIGEAPVGSPSLADDPQEVAALIQELWSGQQVTTVGAGRVVVGDDPDAALMRLDLTPDFSYSSAAADAEILYVHRALDPVQIYFVNNRRPRAEAVEARFRVTGMRPEIWRADTGLSEPVSYRIEGDETIVPLAFEANDSYFVVFSERTSSQSRTLPRRERTPVAQIAGPWTVAFQPDRGAPAQVQLDALRSLSEHADPGVKYFSGIATYTTTFEAPADLGANDQLTLDLGDVGDLAEVRINGRLVGTPWHAPFLVDVSDAVTRGTNHVEVRVANRWVNRLIGDVQPGAEAVAYTTIPTYLVDAPLRPSGLIGPVRLMRSQ